MTLQVISQALMKLRNKYCGELPSRKEWFNILGWWLLGICTEYGIWFVISASHDLLTIQNQRISFKTIEATNDTFSRYCNDLSAGVILIAADGPALIATSICFLLPFKGVYLHIRVIIAIAISVCSFIILSFDISWPLILTGVCLACLCFGIAYSTLLEHISYFDSSRLVASWSSGIGASGFFTSLMYAVLRDCGVRITTLAKFSLSIPAIMAVAFWILLSEPLPKEKTKIDQFDESFSIEVSLIEKKKIGFNCFVRYALPNALIFLFQFTLNQGLFELIVFDKDVIPLTSRVRWFTFLYLASNLLFKSSGQWIRTERLWLLATFQGINLILMTTQAINGWIGTGDFAFWMVILIVFWEGAIAGISYVNILIMINKETESNVRHTALVMTILAEELSILLSGLCTIPLHNFICSMPPPDNTYK